ncbi:hypothetical protein JXB41_01195 [Candidatus Woesearchaeota archaeon]|nr:hypothetical protein [Candidatus Woesearchaeota archaeon]
MEEQVKKEEKKKLMKQKKKEGHQGMGEVARKELYQRAKGIKKFSTICYLDIASNFLNSS